MQADLRAAERDRDVRAQRVRVDSARVAVDAGRQIDGEDLRAARLRAGGGDRGERFGKRALDRPSAPGTEHGIDDALRASERFI